MLTRNKFFVLKKAFEECTTCSNDDSIKAGLKVGVFYLVICYFICFICRPQQTLKEDEVAKLREHTVNETVSAAANAERGQGGKVARIYR